MKKQYLESLKVDNSTYLALLKSYKGLTGNCQFIAIRKNYFKIRFDQKNMSNKGVIYAVTNERINIFYGFVCKDTKIIQPMKPTRSYDASQTRQTEKLHRR
jgi:hypothetical protein